MQSQVQVRAITMTSMPGGGGVEAWVIIVPIILSLLALAVLGVVLYAVSPYLLALHDTQYVCNVIGWVLQASVQTKEGRTASKVPY